ncbi:hypothetical protein M408DRAFT_196262 [Serendipita vermifera MAFF 305830]|uniref:Protein kinase domain-containing protein n=1 Tax=Serendipita vermifera MAFF 305830 TaxID=933852 RepID=A0A0C3A4Q4_SERVB|nr:hypothetical protein M408DRAFT_196262 [Serendipita vermifera MAFF 305830]
MDLLRNLGSAAASSLLHKSGISLPYTLGERVTEYDGKSVWKLYDAIKKDDSSHVSVFHYDPSTPNHSQPMFPQNALKKLRTTRHPDILKYIDLVEQGGSIWIMTERVRPLRGALFSWDSGTSEPAVGGKGKGAAKNKSKEEWTIWGLHRIAVALTFLNNACASTHGNINIDSIFLSPSGEWRLGGFELLSSTKDEKPVLFTHGQQYPHLQDISPPEVKKDGYRALHDLPPGVADAYALAILINTVFNLTTTPPATTQPPHAPLPASARGNIPPTLFPLVKKLFNPNPKVRMTCQAFLEIGMGERAGVEGVSGRFFVDNHLVAVCSKLEAFPLASDGEKAEFLRALKESASSFPPEFAVYRIIPALLSSLEHGGASAGIVLPLIFELAKRADKSSADLASSSQRAFSLDAAEYTARVIKPVIKLFPSPDRGIRMALLDLLPEYEGRLDAKTVQDGIWPHLQTGFADTVPVIREATVKAVSMIATKLSSRVLNNDLLRHLAKAQSDAEPSIRTNTCILIARLAPALSDNTKKKVLVPAFSKALKDPFVHARVAGLAGLTASVDCFEMEDAATRLLGVIGGGLVDKEKLVRDQAFKCFDVYRAKIEAYAASLVSTTYGL